MSKPSSHTSPPIAERLNTVLETMSAAAARAGRDAGEIQLVAVSKTHAPQTIHLALEAGQTLFGESRVQEARAKIPLLPGRARWHFIGHLQKNKIRHALPLFELFHGIDSLEVAQDVNRIAAEAGTFPRILLEVNVAGESSKFGFKPDRLRGELDALRSLDRLTIDGLMCIPPFTSKPEDSRKYFVALRTLRDQLATECRLPLAELSMGMSGDYPIAIEEGATLVRVGTAIFGTRSGKTWKPVADTGFDD
jgi:pyridoxal phosphate enzyme (YggS family)